MSKQKNIVRRGLYRLYQQFNYSLAPLEGWLEQKMVEPKHRSPVFIIGPPRSGSTLIYQSLITAYNFGYLSNLHCWLFGAPWFVEWLFHPSDRYREDEFESRLGNVKGLFAPSECGEFWYRFFPRHPHHVTLEDMDARQLEQIKKAVVTLSKICGKHLLFKNLHCSLRLDPIKQALPGARFVVIDRNIRDVAHSLLKSRRKKFGTYREWFSVEPPGVEQMKQRSVHEQVVEQSRQIYNFIEEKEQEYESDTFHHISYESFCQDSERELQKLDQFFERHEFDVTRDHNIPGHFERRSEIEIEQELYERLIQYIDSKNIH